MPPADHGSKPGVSRLLIQSALDAELRRRLLESPDTVFEAFDLTEEEKDLLRHPDHRLLRLLGAVLAEEVQSPATSPQAPVPQPHAIVQARTLPDISLALTLVPCAQYVDGQLNTFSYAVWVNALPAGADPASLPPPEGSALPGLPLAPLHAVIQVSALQMQDAAGGPQVGLTATLLQASNITAPPPPEAQLDSDAVRAAVAAVRAAPAELRYGCLLDLLHALRGTEAP